MPDKILLLLLLLSLNILHVEIKELPYVLRLITTNSLKNLALCHTSKQVKRVFRQADIKVLDWPGNSPDLNPIENLRSILKSRLKKLDCTTKTKLVEAIIQL